jgi:hypothetical protein
MAEDGKKIALLIGNGDASDELAHADGGAILEAMGGLDKVVAQHADDSTLRFVSSSDDVPKWIEMYQANKGDIQGVVVTLPNAGYIEAIVNSLNGAQVDVPILVHAFGSTDTKKPTDSLRGYMDLCHRLDREGITYLTTTALTINPSDISFRNDFDAFGVTCRVVDGLKGKTITDKGDSSARVSPREASILALRCATESKVVWGGWSNNYSGGLDKSLLYFADDTLGLGKENKYVALVRISEKGDLICSYATSGLASVDSDSTATTVSKLSPGYHIVSVKDLRTFQKRILGTHDSGVAVALTRPSDNVVRGINDAFTKYLKLDTHYNHEGRH